MLRPAAALAELTVALVLGAEVSGAGVEVAAAVDSVVGAAVVVGVALVVGAASVDEVVGAAVELGASDVEGAADEVSGVDEGAAEDCSVEDS